jgi:hypothetical protein
MNNTFWYLYLLGSMPKNSKEYERLKEFVQFRQGPPLLKTKELRAAA